MKNTANLCSTKCSSKVTSCGSRRKSLQELGRKQMQVRGRASTPRPAAATRDTHLRDAEHAGPLQHGREGLDEASLVRRIHALADDLKDTVAGGLTLGGQRQEVHEGVHEAVVGHQADVDPGHVRPQHLQAQPAQVLALAGLQRGVPRCTDGTLGSSVVAARATEEAMLRSVGPGCDPANVAAAAVDVTDARSVADRPPN